MMAETKTKRILFVDDEASIRITLPPILEKAGFEVHIAESVADALFEINSFKFDALVTDLNIGEEGDGFLVASGMRHIQPECFIFILTGYPAFETALQAIHTQVDDYLVKPADVKKLVQSVMDRLNRPRNMPSLKAQPVSGFLREHIDKIVEQSLDGMKADSSLASLPIPDRGRIDHIPRIMGEVIEQLESSLPDRPTERALRAGALHGEVRREQGYSLEMLVEDTRILEGAIYSLLQDNLLTIDLSTLVPDLKRVNGSLDAHLRESLKAFITSKAA